MMRLLVCTDDPTVKKQFGQADRSRSFSLSFVPGEDAGKSISLISTNTLCYIDATSCKPDVKRLLKEYGEKPSLRIGVVDRNRDVTDVGELFRAGAVDYLGPELLKDEIPTRRLRKVADYHPFAETETSPPGGEPGKRLLVSDGSWNAIRSGKEYTFVFLYVEIDLVDEWRKKSGKTHMNDVMTAFHTHINQEVSRLNGKVWMWMESSGLVLFPFDGKNIPVIEACMKLTLDRAIISAEHYTYNTLITYRMAIHVGNTVYRSRGNTGTLVSDTVNFIFHLGQKFLKPGNLLITETAAPFIAPGLANFFLPAGSFENSRILRMRLPRAH